MRSYSGHVVKKCAILADAREESKRREIQVAAQTLVASFERRGIEAFSMIDSTQSQIHVPEGVDLFLVLGGDGAMIHFAARLAYLDLPFYGINYGHLGFMMNTRIAEDVDLHVERLATGAFVIWDFPLLSVRAWDLRGSCHTGMGLNDIYLQRMTPQSCKVEIRINDEPMKINPILCDGVILSTPLGSTAYNFNVTGSMVALSAPVLTLALVAASRSCPVSSIMLPLDTKVSFQVLEPRKRKVQVVSDGQSHGDLTRAEVGIRPNHVKLCFGVEASKNLAMRFIDKACTG